MTNVNPNSLDFESMKYMHENKLKLVVKQTDNGLEMYFEEKVDGTEE